MSNEVAPFPWIPSTLDSMFLFIHTSHTVCILPSGISSHSLFLISFSRSFESKQYRKCDNHFQTTSYSILFFLSFLSITTKMCLKILSPCLARVITCHSRNFVRTSKIALFSINVEDSVIIVSSSRKSMTPLFLILKGCEQYRIHSL